ncbi:hypothetical protein [Phascolarctobacterium succinatutens]|uniref:hypothetical protein n=1 Tax=Phascolarctobacterium succinatutens TaxID=626940 RepID=UPI0026F19D5E|nr:hypothetical protein [Phascolarctobacterium succinatutens]
MFIKRFTTKRLAELSALLSKSFLKAARVAKISSSVSILENFTEVSQRRALILASSSFIFFIRAKEYSSTSPFSIKAYKLSSFFSAAALAWSRAFLLSSASLVMAA